MADLWETHREANRQSAEPLAYRMRPQRLAEFLGQEHFLGPGKLLRRMLDADRLTSVLFYGPPGTGKTTCMCKWMTQEVLLRNKSVRAWRLDGSMANTAEFLNVHGEVLRVPVERFWDDTEEIPGDTMRFVDLPGVSAGDREARRTLVEQVKALPLTETYLVLNASYDLGLLLNHARFFSVLPLSGLILTLSLIHI